MTAAVLPSQTIRPGGDARFAHVHLGDRRLYMHLASGLTRDYYTTRPVPAARVAADFRATVMHLLGHPSTSPEARVAAGHVVIDLEMVEARCVCGGYLTVGPERRLMHLDLCPACVDDAEACGLGHEVKTMCADPRPRQCGHHCRAASNHLASRACGSDSVEDCCGGMHGCDTTVAA